MLGNMQLTVSRILRIVAVAIVIGALVLDMLVVGVASQALDPTLRVVQPRW
jgi:hypothetical protein